MLKPCYSIRGNYMVKRNNNFMIKASVLFFVSIFLLSFTYLCYGSESFINKEDNWYKLQASYELGFLDVLSHTIQFGSTGSLFNYVDEGGQDVLFPFSRITAEINLSKKHNLIFLIQPLDVRTNIRLERDVVVNDVTFKKNTPLDLRYGFTFYRLSYLYDFWKADDRELGIGLSFQIRNATIDFASSDGTQLSSNRNVGPVPIFKFRFKYPFNNGFWIGGEFDGFYASGKYITGSSNDFEGAIADAYVRTGFKLTDYLDTFLNVRYIGGGAKGTEKNPSGPGDGFTNNWLKTMEISVGFYAK
ncbi:MAG: hypothetical protein QG641_1252 [Candidatus Poribacteria bacterium]|nr:hypothetical protein [Candidatus Poribacteria bacterium]